MGIFTVVAQIGNTLLGNASIKLERQIGTAGRVGVFAKFDENGNVRGGGRIGHDIGPNAHASIGVDIDSKQNVYACVNGHFDGDTMKCDGQVSIDQNVRVAGSFSAHKDLDTLGNIGGNIKVGSDGVSLGANGNVGPVSMNGVVNKGADGVTYDASASFFTEDGYVRGKLSGSGSGVSGSIEGLAHDSQGTYMSGDLQAGGHKSTTGSLNICRDPQAPLQDPVSLFNTGLKKRQETYSSMAFNQAERNAVNRDGQNGSLSSMDWENSMRKKDAKVETFSASSHSIIGSALTATAIGSTLPSSVERPSHIPTHDIRVFGNVQAQGYKRTTGRWNVCRDPSDVFKDPLRQYPTLSSKDPSI